MPLYEVTFMNHIVETYLVEAKNDREAWETPPEDVEELEPLRWDSTMCEVTDVERSPSRHTQIVGNGLLALRPWAGTGSENPQ